MKTQSSRIATAALVAIVAAGAGAALAGEGGQHSAQRARLQAEWAEARARDAANPDATLVERLFGLGGQKTKVVATR